MKDEFPALFRLVMVKEDTLRILYERKVDWDFQFRRRLYEWEEWEVIRLKDLLENGPAIRVGMEDCSAWDASLSSEFSVSSAYKSVEANLGQPLKISKLVWIKYATPKVQFFGWLAWRNRVKTVDFL